MIHRDQWLINICNDLGSTSALALTHKGQPVHIGRMLYAITGKESSFGQRRTFVKHEPAYMPGGKYYVNSPKLRQAYYKYGVLASSSFGAFQIIYITAEELGFAGNPVELISDRICGYYALQLIEKRFSKAKTLTHVLDAYNSGNHYDTNVPYDYIAAVTGYYEELNR